MPHVLTRGQSNPATRRPFHDRSRIPGASSADQRRVSPHVREADVPSPWAPDPAETIAHTASRRTGPRAWLLAVERAVEAGLVPGFNKTTQAIIEVLASRMNFDTGHCRYVLQDVMKRTGLGRTAVTNHVRMLRAGGWLAWVEHGSQRNALRGQPGYARTATVYAATIPPAYDLFAGHIVVGSGYRARVIVDHRTDTPVDTAGKAPVDNTVTGSSRTPSRWVVKEEGQVQVVGGEDTSTGQARTACKPPRRKKKVTITGYKITGERIERARRVAKWVRPLVNWVQRATLDQLSWVLLDPVARDWTDNQILLWLGRVGREIGAPRWQPRFPHRVIAAALRRRDQADTQRAHGYAGPAPDAADAAVPPNEAFALARQVVRANGQAVQARISPREPGGCKSWSYGEHDRVTLTQAERADLLKAVAADPGLVLAEARVHGRESAITLYGTVGARILDAVAEFRAAGIGRVSGSIA